MRPGSASRGSASGRADSTEASAATPHRGAPRGQGRGTAGPGPPERGERHRRRLPRSQPALDPGWSVRYLRSSNRLITARLALSLLALVFGGFGVFALLDPVALGDLVGLPVATPAARVEIRAVYGGLELGLALVLGAFARSRTAVRPGLGVALVVVVLLAAVRAIALGLESDRPRAQWWSLGVELGCVVLLLGGLITSRRPRDGERS